MLTPTALAAALNVSESTVGRMRRDGCPCMLAGMRPRYDLEEVKAWMKERAQQQERPCPHGKTPPDAGTSRYASIGAAYTDASRKVHLRVTPSA